MITGANRIKVITVGADIIPVEVFEEPFREGVELRCSFEGEIFRVSDRQLGEREAWRILLERLSAHIGIQVKGPCSAMDRGGFMERLRNYFGVTNTLKNTASGDVTPYDLQVAAAVLMLYVTGLDSEVTPEESRAIVLSLSREFGIDREQTERLVETASSKSPNHSVIAAMIEEIREGFDSGQKQLILSMIWKVILADGVSDRWENAFAAQLRTTLDLTLEQSVRARRLAEDGNDLKLAEVRPSTELDKRK